MNPTSPCTTATSNVRISPPTLPIPYSTKSSTLMQTEACRSVSNLEKDKATIGSRREVDSMRRIRHTTLLYIQIAAKVTALVLLYSHHSRTSKSSLGWHPWRIQSAKRQARKTSYFRQITGWSLLLSKQAVHTHLCTLLSRLVRSRITS